MYGRRLPILALAAVVTLLGGFALAAFVAPMDADQGFMQKIFYLHVPLAIVALGGFIFGAYHGVQHLRTDDPSHDLKSYVAIHLALILGTGALITGSIWARASWGKWWVWDEPTLVAFLIIFLLYCVYQPLRFSIEDRDRQARYASVFAVTAGVFAPLCFLAVRLSDPLIHPRTLDSTDNLPGAMRSAFLLCLLGMTLLYVALWKFELAHKHTRAQLHALQRRLGARAAVRGRSAAPQVVVK